MSDSEASDIRNKSLTKDNDYSEHDVNTANLQKLPITVKSTSKSIGVRKAEILNEQYQSPALKVLLFITIFIVAYTYGLDGTIRYTFQTYATNSYAKHSLLSTVNVIRSVVAAASQPVYARLSDRFGRLELFVVSILFYVVGTVIESQAFDVQRFAGGAVMYQIGYSGVMLLIQVILADFSNLNWRLVCSFVPASPFIINTWVSGDVAQDLLDKHHWSYCIGIWAFIFPLTCIPFVACLIHMVIKARRTEEWKALVAEEKQKKKWTSIKKNILIDLFWELDIPGILFIICILGFILVPFTLAGGVTSTWKKASTIAPLVIGFVLIPFFVVWEQRYARFPVVPFKLLKDRGVWSALIVAIFINFIWYMPNDFLYTVLVVGMNQSIKAATRITQLYSFVSVIVGPLLGFLLVSLRRTKGFIIFGVCCWFVSLGLLVEFRGGTQGTEYKKFVDGIIGSLCLLGFGAGFFTYTTQVSITTCTNHEYMAVLLSLYLSCYNVGSAFGTSVSGAVWTNVLFDTIKDNFAKNGLNATDATTAYSSPLTFITTAAWGSPERVQVVIAYAHVQRILCIIGLVLCVPLLLATLFLRDHRLDSVQSLELDHDHSQGIKDDHDMIVVNDYDNDIIMKKIRGLFSKSKN